MVGVSQLTPAVGGFYRFLRAQKGAKGEFAEKGYALFLLPENSYFIVTKVHKLWEDGTWVVDVLCNSHHCTTCLTDLCYELVKDEACF
jgi:hypothetical protein